MSTRDVPEPARAGMLAGLPAPRSPAAYDGVRSPRKPLSKIVLLGSSPPRQRGIAAFASDLANALIGVSTPYWYAEELLAEGRGMLVPFRDADAIAEAVLAIERRPAMRREMGRRAAEFGRRMLWPEVGRKYLASFARALDPKSAVADRPRRRADGCGDMPHGSASDLVPREAEHIDICVRRK